MVYVGVEDLLTSLQKVKELGGKVIVEPMPIPGFGEFAMFQDPDGAMMGLFEERPAREVR
jgi:predicted enzyme related to lactoylglutathione lyase